MGLLNNIIEIRADAFGLCRAYRRPIYKSAEDIGSWTVVFETMSLMCCLTNVAIICFVSSNLVTASSGLNTLTGFAWLKLPVQHEAAASIVFPGGGDSIRIPNLGVLDFDALQGRLGPDVEMEMASPIGSWFENQNVTAEAKLDLTVINNPHVRAWDSLDTQPGRVKSIQLWIALLVIEHIVLLLRVGFKQVHQNEPAWVQIRRTQIDHIMETHAVSDADRAKKKEKSKQYEARRIELAARKIQSTWRMKVVRMRMRSGALQALAASRAAKE